MGTQVNYEAALRDPGGCFAEPREVAAQPQLSLDQKIAILRQWEQDALRLSASEAEGMVGGKDAMLGRVEQAIRAVLETRH